MEQVEHKAFWYHLGPKRGRRVGCPGYESIMGLREGDGFELAFSAAAAFAMAKLTPRMALAPRFVLFGVPSSFIRNSSTLS